ncbi:MAG: glycosyltransferase [Thermoanaerobaculia bacterium]
MHHRENDVTIYYLIADYPVPSWGVGMLYEHVRLLRDVGHHAVALHHRSPFRPDWIDVEVPIAYLDDAGFAPREQDIVVVPEVLAASEVVSKHPWRRVIFVQGSFLILGGLGGAAGYPELGYEAGMAVLPHVAAVVERHFGLSCAIVAPFVASYFFEPSPLPRSRRILFAGKEAYRSAGIPDQDIALRLLAREIGRRPGWELVCLDGYSHREVAALMSSSMFLVNVNSHEAFNTTVPEAMAAGCIPICYEATGGRDFLRDGENAVVFANQQVYALVERVCDLVDRLDDSSGLLSRLRAGGRETATSFTAARTASALESFFASLDRS